MSAPTLSVCMCNYNHGQYLPRAIEAVVSQSRPPDEYLILDDGSTDSSLEIIESYAARYPFIHVLRNERNLGVMASTPKVLGAVTGEYIYCGAADDYVLPGFFEKAMEMAEQYPEAGVIFGQIVTLNPQGEVFRIVVAPRWPESRYASPEEFLRDYLEAPSVISPSGATVYRGRALLEIGGCNPDLGPCYDTMAIWALGAKYGAGYVAERAVVMSTGPDTFYEREMRNPRHMLDITAACVRFMRSPELRPYLPDSFVGRWERNRRQVVIRRHIQAQRARLGHFRGASLLGDLLASYLKIKLGLYRGNPSWRVA